MACLRRKQTGKCNHHQCKFRRETEHGYQCVSLVFDEGLGIVCEVGEGCVRECEYAYPANGEKYGWCTSKG